MAIVSGCWIWAYSHWLQQANDQAYNCCSWYSSLQNEWVFAECINAPITGSYHVSEEFRVLNIWGVVLFVLMACVSLGHCIKPFRCFTKIFGCLIWVLVFIYVICAMVYRFREPGRACSMDLINTLVGANEHAWYE